MPSRRRRSEYSVLVLIARAGASLEGVTVGGDRSRFEASKQATALYRAPSLSDCIRPLRFSRSRWVVLMQTSGSSLLESYCELGASGPCPATPPQHTEAWDADHEWDLASNATANDTGMGGPDNLVPHGSLGAEYRTMKAAYSHSGDSLLPRGAGTPHRDPYHGRTTEPKTVREPPCESFNLMVVGEAGLGKTTLLESFFQSFKDDEAAFALFERKETAIEIETRRQLAEAGAARNAAERELQAAVEKAQYAKASTKQKEMEELSHAMAALGARLKELSSADERQRNELRSLRECCRGLRLEMKRAADQAAFVPAAERQLEATILQAECDLVHGELKQMRRGSGAEAAGGTPSDVGR